MTCEIPPIVTNDSHYTYATEAESHDALLCIRTGKNISDPDRFRFDGTGCYLKSTQEMYAIDSSDAWQQGCANTRLVAEQIDTTGWFEPKNLMPRFDVSVTGSPRQCPQMCSARASPSPVSPIPAILATMPGARPELLRARPYDCRVKTVSCGRVSSASSSLYSAYQPIASLVAGSSKRPWPAPSRAPRRYGSP